MNSSKSGARSIDLSPKELDGVQALSRRPREPVAQTMLSAVVLGERGDAQNSLKPHRVSPQWLAGRSSLTDLES
jgi:DNA-binding winged helix-turn-helix (wHTH) protein